MSVSTPRPKRTAIASSKLLDPENAAQPESIRSHQHAIEAKRAAELADRQQHATNNPGPSGNSAVRSSSPALQTLSRESSTIIPNSSSADGIGCDNDDELVGHHT